MLRSSLSCAPQWSSPGLSLIGPDVGLADVALQDLGRFLGAFGLESIPETYVPLGAAGLSARDLKLLLPCTSTAPLDEQLQHCALVCFSLFQRPYFLLLLFPNISFLLLTPLPFPCCLRVFRCRNGVQAGVCVSRGSPIPSVVHQRSPGRVRAPSMTLLNYPGGVVGINRRDQNVGVGLVIPKRIYCKCPTTVAVLHPAKESFSLLLQA